MILVSTDKAIRLAKARAKRNDAQRRHSAGEDCWVELRDARHDFNRAAVALAEELILEGFAGTENDYEE